MCDLTLDFICTYKLIQEDECDPDEVGISELLYNIQYLQIFGLTEFKEDVNLLNISEEPGFSKVENISDSIHKSSFKTKPDIEISSPLKKNISIYDEVMENVSKIKPAKNQIDEFNFTL